MQTREEWLADRERSWRMPTSVAVAVVVLTLQCVAQSVEALRPAMQLWIPGLQDVPPLTQLWGELLERVAVAVALGASARRLLQGRRWAWWAALVLEAGELGVRGASALTVDPVDGVGPVLGMVLPVVVLGALLRRDALWWVRSRPR